MDQFSPKPSSSSTSAAAAAAAAAAADAAGLKMTISLKQKSPFYQMRPEPTPPNETTGATNLMAARGLEHSYIRLTTKKMKDSLSSFLPQMPGVIDTPGSEDNSSLRGVIDKPPVGGKELHALSILQLAGFRLHPGPLPEQYRGQALDHGRPKKKHKKNKYRSSDLHPGLGAPPASAASSVSAAAAATATTSAAASTSGAAANESEGRGEEERERERRRERKHKRHDKDAEDRKKRKKEKKRKKNKEEKD